MKIKKEEQQILESLLVEADDTEKEVEKAAEEAELDLTDKEVEQVADEIEKAEDKIDAEETITDLDISTDVVVENAITKALNKSLNAVKVLKTKNTGKDNPNVLICGLPGSGKTAIVYAWGNQAEGLDIDLLTGKALTDKRVNIAYLNMKNNDLDAYINGYTGVDSTDPEYTKQLYSHNLDDLDRPNSILFLDEYNRQTKDQIRGSVLSLINEHYVVGKGKGGKRYFPNFLFTIAVMNPALGKSFDPGAAELNDAEKTRFVTRLEHQNSDKETARQFIDTWYLKNAKKAADKKDYWTAEKLLRLRDLGLYIVDDPRFKFDGELTAETIEDLRDEILGKNPNWSQHKVDTYIQTTVLSQLELAIVQELKQNNATMLNQRHLTSGLSLCQGELGSEVDEFKEWLADGAKLLLDTDDMIWEILEDYSIPSAKTLFSLAGIENPELEKETAKQDTSAAQQAEAPVEEPEEIEDKEDDADLWLNASTNAQGQTAVSPTAAEQSIEDAISSWL